ncbi:MAG: GDSL-type esterase/lipase family protein [Planctomycetota bacterium]
MRARTSMFSLLGALILPCLAVWPAETPPGGKPERIACVGDSITFGDGIVDRDHNSYPAQLAKLLGPNWRVGNFGVCGTTLLNHGHHPYWGEPALRAAQEFEPSVVVIALGTNDSMPQNWKTHKNEFQTDYANLIARFKALKSKPAVLVCVPPPAYSSQWGISDEVIRLEIGPAVRSVAQKAGAAAVDLYTALVGKGSLFSDTIHPNKEGARLIAETVLAAVRAHGAAKEAAAADSIDLGNFEKGLDEWYTYLGYEFPGASAELARDETQAAEGKASLKLIADLTAGGKYVALCRNLDVKEGQVKAVKFSARSSDVPSFSVRFVDATEQVHQQPVKLEGGEWNKITITKFEGEAHWNGADDGQVHYPLKMMQICVGGGDGSKAQFWIDDVRLLLAELPNTGKR